MAVIISGISLKGQAGKSTVLSVLAIELAKKGKKTLVIDNNNEYAELDKYLMCDVVNRIDNIKSFFIGNIAKKSVLSSITEINKNLYLLAGSKNPLDYNSVLNFDELVKLKNQVDDEFDYILIENRAGLTEDILKTADFISNYLFLFNQSENDIEAFNNISICLPEYEQKMFKKLIDKSLVIVNKFSDDIKFKLDKTEKLFTNKEIMKIYYDESVYNFSQGYKIDDMTDFNYIVDYFTNRKIDSINGKASIFTRVARIIGIKKERRMV